MKKQEIIMVVNKGMEAIKNGKDATKVVKTLVGFFMENKVTAWDVIDSIQHFHMEGMNKHKALAEILKKHLEKIEDVKKLNVAKTMSNFAGGRPVSNAQMRAFQEEQVRFLNESNAIHQRMVNGF